MVSGVGQCAVKFHVGKLHWLGKCRDRPVAYSTDWVLCGTAFVAGCERRRIRGGVGGELRLGSVTQTNEPLHNRVSVARGR